ncbi:MAG: T9SS type A sorting domain-containing protein [Flavobacteriia bacterium]|nr:T9SS type A sorting domain-containing protein [Flavobacteriia bacterium]
MKNSIILIISLWVSISTGAQSLNAYILYLHGPSCDNQSGQLMVQAVGGSGNYTYLWSNGSTNDTISNLSAGSYSVTVYSGVDSVVKNLNVAPFGVSNVFVHNACNGNGGSIYLDDIIAPYPLQFHWYQNQVLMNESGHMISNLAAGNYQYAVIDAEGCIDSGPVVVSASSPHLDVFLSDSSLCWGTSSQVWFTPGFTLIDGSGNYYNSTIDTFTYIDQMGSSGIPQQGMDSLGCWSNYIDQFPFVYLQPHPDQMTLYLIQDTLSLSFVPFLSPDPVNTYSWYRNGVLVTENAFSYLVVNTGGFYSVGRTNQYGCSNNGTLQVSFATVDQLDNDEIHIYPNPSITGESWQVEVKNFNRTLSYRLFDSNGRQLSFGECTMPQNAISVPSNAGVYFLEIENKRYKLMATD